MAPGRATTTELTATSEVHRLSAPVKNDLVGQEQANVVLALHPYSAR